MTEGQLAVLVVGLVIVILVVLIWIAHRATEGS